MKKLKIGIVGIGGIATFVHIPSWLRTQEAEIVAVCDINEKKMDFELLPKGVKKFTDYKKMIEETDIDVVDICTPNYLHSEIAVFALNAGKNVFSEKPDAISPEELQKMIDAEKKSGKKLMVMRNNRHMQCSKYLKSIVSSGELGEIYAGRCGWIRRRGIPGKGGWFTTKALSGGGPLIDLGVHMIDLSIYLMGNPKAVAVSGSTYCKFANDNVSDSVHAMFGEKNNDGVFDVEDLATGFIKFENGASLQIEFSWASNIEKESKFMELRGTKGGVSFENDEIKLFGEENGILFDKEPASKLDCDGHYNNLKHFVNVLLGREQSDYNTSQGMNIIKILSAIYQSAKEGREIVL